LCAWPQFESTKQTKPETSGTKSALSTIRWLEAIVVKQRDELFKRGYATDDSVCIGDPQFAQGWCADTYKVKK